MKSDLQTMTISLETISAKIMVAILMKNALTIGQQKILADVTVMTAKKTDQEEDVVSISPTGAKPLLLKKAASPRLPLT